MDVELDEEQSAALRKALGTYVSDLRMEIADTDNPGYRRELRDERASLESVIEKLNQAAKEAPASNGSGRVQVRWLSIWEVDDS